MTEHTQRPQAQRPDKHLLTRSLGRGAVIFLGLVVLTGVASAQSQSHAFCGTQMAQTVENVFTVIQLAGPLLGGVLALGATVALPIVSRVDYKKELKETRNNALLYGVIVAPLATSILAFIMNFVVAGGPSCGF